MMDKIEKKVRIVKDNISVEAQSKLIGLTGHIVGEDSGYYEVQLKGFGRQLKPLFHCSELEFL